MAGLAEKSVFPLPGSPNNATWNANGLPSASDNAPAAVDRAGKRHMVADVCHVLGSSFLTNVWISLGSFLIGQGSASASSGRTLRLTWLCLVSAFVSMWFLPQLMSPNRSFSSNPNVGKCLSISCLLLVT